MGLSATLATASKSLELFSAGMQVAGQNVANASTPGYIRESLNISTNSPYRQGDLILGTGASAQGVQQQVDRFLETRIHTANADAESSRTRTAVYGELENAIGELGDGDLSSHLNDFLASIHEVVNQPELATSRRIAVTQGEQLAGNIRTLRSRIDRVRSSLNAQVDSLVAEANTQIDRIAELNEQITRLEAGGSGTGTAGALRTQRYRAMNRLSEIMPVQFRERENSSIDAFTTSDYLILSGQTQHLETTTESDRDAVVRNVHLSTTKSELPAGGGELRGVIDGRDAVLGDFVDQLDAYTASLVFEFNRIHSSGEGLRGFTSVTAASRVDDSNVALNAAGLAFTPEHGSFQLKITNALSGVTQTKTILVDLDGIGGNDTTLESLRDQITLSGGGSVTASITTDRRLTLETTSDYEIRFADDSSGVLAALGINTFFTGSSSRDIGVNSVVADNHEYFAASRGGGPSDGSNVIQMAAIIDKPVEALGGVSLDEFYDSTVASLAQAAASESAIAEGYDAFRDSLMNQRAQISGVSLDEETIKILEFQRAYQAAARVISTVDELFGVLMSL